MDLLELFKLKAEHWFTGLMMTLATFAPGSLILFHFQRKLFIDLDLGKIILLSISLTLPLIFVNLILSLPHALEYSEVPFDAKDPIDNRQHIMSACLFTCIPLYVGLAISYWFVLSFSSFCICVAVLNALVAALSWGSLLRKAHRPTRLQ